MRLEHARRRVLEAAAAAGIHGVAFTDAGPLPEARRHLDGAVADGHIPSGSIPAARTLERLVTPRMRLKTARSVITAYLSYHTGEPMPDDPALGVIAPYTRANYYNELETRLSGVAAVLEDEFAAACRVSSNYVTLAEKPLAARSGLGFYGKNGIIINPRHGSSIVLGEILTDIEFEPGAPLDTACGECAACIKACPTGAIVAPGRVNRGRCIQFIGERRGSVPYDIRGVWGNRLYGCTVCQDVCPFNRDIPAAAPPTPCAFVGNALPLADAMRMGEEEFRRRFDGNQIGMRERNVIRRNAVIAAGCSGISELAGPVINCLNDPDPMLRAHAAWALGALGGAEARPALERAVRSEWDPDARAEAARALDGIP
jgi:epoxyqueuosine reductase